MKQNPYQSPDTPDLSAPRDAPRVGRMLVILGLLVLFGLAVACVIALRIVAGLEQVT